MEADALEDVELPPLDPNDPTLLEEDPEAPAEPPPSKPRLLTMRLIAERCLDKAELEQLSAEESAERVIGLTHLRLDRLRIGSMDGLELCNGATHIHLQHNLLREIESLDFFNALQFLVLAHNQLEALDGLAHLATLQYLDVSFNRIADAPVEKLPTSLKALDLHDNPCCESPDYRARLIAGLERRTRPPNPNRNPDRSPSPSPDQVGAPLHARRRGCLSEGAARRGGRRRGREWRGE